MPTPSADRTAAPNRRSATGGRWYRRVERLLLLIALVTLGAFMYTTAEAFLYQALENRALDAILANPRPRPDSSLSPVPSAGLEIGTAIAVSRPAPGSILGRIEIPR